MPYDDNDWLQDSFFTKHPRDIFEDGEFTAVPTMIGTTKDEGLLQAAWFYNNPDKINKFWYGLKGVESNIYVFIHSLLSFS